MTTAVSSNGTRPTPPMGFPNAPAVRAAHWDDIGAALKAGISDLIAAPRFGLFFGLVYVLGGLILLACLFLWDTPWAIIPLAIAFPLLGPFIAVGLYEVSRRLTAGEPLSWRAVLGVVVRQKDRQLSWMAFVVLFAFWIWVYQLRLLLALFLGFAAFASLDSFVEIVTTTEDGLVFLAVGTMIGAVLALTLFSLTVFSIPLLVERDLDFVTAIVVSVTAVKRSPVVMLGWGAVVTLAMLAALAPAFLGLLVVLPILGHATWRLYERVIVH